MIAGHRILVVEDDPEIRFVVAQVLRDDGYAVQVAANGKEALQIIGNSKPDVVLLDMQMPILDGWAFAKKVNEGGHPVPIVVMTAAQNARRSANEVNAVAYLPKPFDLDDLLAVVERTCSIPVA